MQAGRRTRNSANWSEQRRSCPYPTDVKLKDPKDFVLIGKDIQRLDAHDKSSGTAIFTQDIKLPDMLVAAVIYPPRFGATVKSFDATAAKQMPNVANIVQFKTSIREGVAVLARDFYSAKKARDAVKVQWDETSAFKMGSDAIFAEYKALAQKPGAEARKDGDFDKSFAGAAHRIEAALPVPVPGACVDGTHELRAADQARWLRGLEWRAVPHRRPECDRRQSSGSSRSR